MMEAIRRIAPEFRGRAFVDSAPVAERSLAAAAGLGWIGRNGCLIVPGLGSYVVLAEIVCNLELVPDGPLESSCGDCDACVRACPTGACLGDSLVDARRCLSYLTIEHRGPVGREFWPLWGTRVFGCDACQEACPHNRDLPAGDAGLLDPAWPADETKLAAILGWTQADWDAATTGSVRRRATFEMFLRNAVLAAGCSRDASLAEPLERLYRRCGQLGLEIDWALGALRQQGN
jgi:epoxyqueuosine reductase